MKSITLEQVLDLHEQILAATGGAPGIRDEGRIEAALARPFSGFGGKETFPTLEEKAAALTHALIKDHPFVDGNKRTAIAAGGIFLRLNGYRLTVGQEDLEETAVAVAEDRMDVSDLARWFNLGLEKVRDTKRNRRVR